MLTAYRTRSNSVRRRTPWCQGRTGHTRRPGSAGVTRSSKPEVGSAVDQSLEVLGVAGSLDLDPVGGALDLAEVVGGQRDGGCSEVLFQAFYSTGARDRHDPGLLGEQPGQRDLGRRGVLPGCDLPQ